MAAKTGALQEAELRSFLANSRMVLARCAVQTRTGLCLLPRPDGETRVTIDTRLLCAAVVALTELADHASARSICSYVLSLQRPTGAWDAHYDRDGRAGIVAEDVTAFVLWALMTYIRASGDDALAEQAREQVEEAVRFTRACTLNPYLNLIETTTSLHGGTAGEGYDLWTNCAHAAAFALCHRVYGGAGFRRPALHIRRAIGLLMTFEGRFLRRLDPGGYPDPRADISLVAPHYFGLWAPTERMVMNSADLIERTLWNVEFGGYIRYLPFSAEERQGMFGPSPRFAAWMADYHYELGNKDRAEAIMRWIFDGASQAELADVLVPSATATRYLRELRRPNGNGKQPQVPLDGQRERLLADLEGSDRPIEESGVIPTGAPSVWAHLETLRALRRGGYLDRWRLGTEPARFGEGPEPRS